MNILSLGCPRPCGGANVELGHTLLLLRYMGVGVDVMPTTPEAPNNPWPSRLKAAGCRILSVADYRSIRNRLILAMQNARAVYQWPDLKHHGCRLIYSPCMTYTERHEYDVFRTCPPTAVHFQSRFQAGRLADCYKVWGTRHQVIIPGAFQLADFPFRPAGRFNRFTVGKLSRSTQTKWPSNLWPLLTSAKQKIAGFHFLAQAWDDTLAATLGPPPPWTEALPQEHLTATTFLARCHALLCLNGPDVENWPRVGLEAMAAGVPIIAPRSGGWPEMLGSAALLVDSDVDAIADIRRLAHDEPFRIALSWQARRRAEELADTEAIAEAWEGLLDAVNGPDSRRAILIQAETHASAHRPPTGSATDRIGPPPTVLAPTAVP